ncbi:MAG: glyoxalase [Candidatus Accumulibacter sp.]|jgi:hypothetical protein|nr:glyoxalase [Accumulibacter sp.]
MHATFPEEIDVLFIAGFGPIVTNQKASERLYSDMLRLPLESIEGYDGYLYTARVKGVKHFALWPLDKAALSCFGKNEWPKELPVPQAWLEVDVADIEVATRVLEQAGYRLLVRLQQEPWGQTVTRFLSPEGMLMAVTHTPFLRGKQ